MHFPTKKDYVAIIDFEATCSDRGEIQRDETEIIEFACFVVDRNLNEIFVFDKFVKPQLHPRLTEFCIKLTSITQDMVDKAHPFPEVVKEFMESVVEPFTPLFASWGKYDKNQLLRDCKRHNVPYPFDDEHLDLKRWLPRYLPMRKPLSIGKMLDHLGMKFKGTPHRGIDDVRNILRILRNVEHLIPSEPM